MRPALPILPGVKRTYARGRNAIHGERIEEYALAALESVNRGTAVVARCLYTSKVERAPELYYKLLCQEGFGMPDSALR